MVKRFVGVLLVVGAVLGAWRYLGDGASITDPQWFDNASANVRELLGWSDGTVRDRTQRGHPTPSHSPTSTRTSSPSPSSKVKP